MSRLSDDAKPDLSHSALLSWVQEESSKFFDEVDPAAKESIPAAHFKADSFSSAAREAALVDHSAIVGSGAAAESAVPLQLVVVDGQVTSSGELITGLKIDGVNSDFHVRYLDSNCDGVEQISRLLGESGRVFDALHIFSASDTGHIRLGSVTLDDENLHLYAGELMSWASALSMNSDLMIYGCSFPNAGGSSSFVDSLAMLIESDVAVSKDISGGAALSGNWDLEVSLGDVQYRVFEAATSSEDLDTCDLETGGNGEKGSSVASQLNEVERHAGSSHSPMMYSRQSGRATRVAQGRARD